jgi:hypothetical protein
VAIIQRAIAWRLRAIRLVLGIGIFEAHENPSLEKGIDEGDFSILTAVLVGCAGSPNKGLWLHRRDTTNNGRKP